MFIGADVPWEKGVKIYLYKKKNRSKTKENLGLLKFKNLQANFLTFHSKLHWQLVAPDGLAEQAL